MTTPELNPGNATERLVEQNKDAAEIIGRHAEVFDSTGADMIMRNLAVITDRLKSEQFSALSDETRHQVGVIAFIAQDVAPQADGDRVRYKDESDDDYRYRTTIWGPLHSLQGKIHTNNFDPNDELMVSKLRFAVTGAGLAFASVLTESTAIPEIKETERYFWGNTVAATRIANRLASDKTEVA